MKIGILTQSINNNYGGILQNYALQTILRRMGHEVITLNWDSYHCDHAQETIWQKILIIAKTFVWRSIMRHKLNYPWEQKRLFYMMSVNNHKFIKNHLRISKWLWSRKEFRKFILKNKIEVIIVGSDQTWRPKYNRNGMLYRMFLDFTKGLNIKRIAYAASFGVDLWEYNNHETNICSKLINKFDYVSVREESGVLLCKTYLNRNDVKWMLDPTLLLPNEDYINLLRLERAKQLNFGITTYILDENNEKKQLIQEIAKEKRMKVTSFVPKYCYLGTATKESIVEYTTPSVTEWLQAFYNAKYIICDSFHGTVFSIIFNKQFITITNPNRGTERFLSLLKRFGLENRLINQVSSDVINVLDTPINWTTVNALRETLCQDCLTFIKETIATSTNHEIKDA